MKYLNICRYVKHYISSMLGKLEGLVIIPHRGWISKVLNKVNTIIRLYWNKPIDKGL